MNERQQNLRIGIFTVSGLLLLLTGLFFLGLSDLFAAKMKIFTYFSESAQGLTVGSSVKYRGVPVGTVSKLSIDMDSKKVLVTMEIEPEHFHSTQQKLNAYGVFERLIRKEVENGLRCRLEFAGITGMKFIELDYFASPNAQTRRLTEHYALVADAEYIPSVPSTIKDLTATLSGALDRLSRIRFEDIAGEMERSLSKLSELLSDPAISSAINRINEAAEHLESGSSTILRVLDENRLNRILNSLEKDLDVLKNLGEQLSNTTREMKLPDTTESFRRGMSGLQETRNDFEDTLSKLNQTLESIKILADYLSKDPASIIKGKKNPAGEK